MSKDIINTLLAIAILCGCGGGSEPSDAPEKPEPAPEVKQLTLAFQNGDLNNPGGGRVMTARVIVYTSGLDAQEFTESSVSGEFNNDMLIHGFTTYDLWINEEFARSGEIDFKGENSFCLLTWYLSSTYSVSEVYHSKDSYCN